MVQLPELRIISADEQRMQIRGATSLDKYRDLYAQVFPDDPVSEFWIRDISLALPKLYSGEAPPQYFQLLAVPVYQLAQLGGIRSMMGQEGRYNSKGWHKRHYLSVEHQFGLLGYLGRINTQANDKRRDLLETFKGSDPVTIQGIQGLRFGADRGEVAGYVYDDMLSMKLEARKRVIQGDPVYQFDESLNVGLKEVGFTGMKRK